MPRILNPAKFLFLLIALAAIRADAQVAATAPAELSVSRCWTNAEIAGGKSAALESDTIFVGSAQGEIAAFSAGGRMLWSSELGGRVSSNLLITETSIIAVTSVIPAAGGEQVDLLRSLSKVTGVTNWIAKLAPASRYSLTVSNDDVVVVGSGGQILAVNQKSGAAKWNRTVPTLTAEPLFARGKVMIAVEGQQMLTVSLETGETENSRKLPGNASVIAENSLGQIVTGDERGNVFLLNGTDKPVWKFKSGGAITRLYVVIDYIVAVSNDNFVYHLLMRNGDVDWKRRLSGRVAGAGVVGDRYVVTQSLDDQSIVFTDLQTGKTAGQFFVETGEILSGNVVNSGSSVFLTTDRGLHRVSIEGCPAA